MIIDGKQIAREILARAKARAERLSHPPRVVAYVANDPTPATRSYLAIKKRSAEAAGCVFEESQDATAFAEADAAIVQLPVPDEDRHLLDEIPLPKDADVLIAMYHLPESDPKWRAAALTAASLPPAASRYSLLGHSRCARVRLTVNCGQAEEQTDISNIRLRVQLEHPRHDTRDGGRSVAATAQRHSASTAGDAVGVLTIGRTLHWVSTLELVL